MKITELRSKVEELRSSISSLSALTDITPEQDADLTAALDEFETRAAELDALEAREARVAAATARVTGSVEGAPAVHIARSEVKPGELRNKTRGEIRDLAFEIVEKRAQKLAPRQLDYLDSALRAKNDDCDGGIIAKRLVATENDAYRNAWMKTVTNRSAEVTAEESAALSEFRAMSEGTSSAGGYGLPVLIDPTIILTSQAVNAPILDVARIVPVTTNVWKGVTSAGVSWEYHAEASAVADAAPTLAQPSITVYTADGFIPYSIEVEMDYPGFAEEVAMLLAGGYVDLLASKTLNGTGSSQPKGIFQALSSDSTSWVVTTTAGVLGSVDVTGTFEALRERFRGRGTWVTNVATLDKIRLLGTATTAGSFTVDLTQSGVPKLMGRDVIVSDYAPKQPSSTTAGAPFLLLGDFSQFVIAQRAGMSVEPIQQLFDTSTGRPTGSRGFFAYARHGFDAATTSAFKGLTNKTS